MTDEKESFNKGIAVRFAPSPTGPFHIGSVRTALYNFLFARKNGGKFLLRIEDTDKERSTKEFEENIFDSLKWLGLDWDDKDHLLRQSERTAVYTQKIHELIEKGAAYISKESEGKNKEVIRFKNPGGKIKFQDLIRGEVEMDVSDLEDFIIARNINEPVYHLTVVVDDMESEITHIIRGEDHISNTPRHILILEALGGSRPIYAHLPLVLAPDRSKLSKRKHGESVSLNFYKNAGYLPEAIINFLAMVGWNPGTDQEIFTINELIKDFDIKKVQKKGGIFNIEKLDWLNREHILKQSKNLQIERLKGEILKTKFKDYEKVGDPEFLDKFLVIILDRIHRWGEVSEILEAGEFDHLFIDKPELNKEIIHWKKSTPEKARENLEKVVQIFNEEKTLEIIWTKIEKLAEERGKGDVLWPLRYALSGREKSPDPFTLIKIKGVKASISSILSAIEKLS
ncbi:MAG: hypothetical protein A3A96_00115 [Candidatus Zambryskibacteria bacterium RIFCSPLOWO2_01_FULL_39_39]|uniref:Glutamate--tRNA ligase n=1 Tax=Candidatus Zambryskibacteria bacterium RIFCSPLOWO2_01_FULL_39_39 TaxID=1802758 RepID=A0A1G2TZ44_9BACT|nr:MAG: Glutamate-tRNA ligase [Parcubacteria group bacterium GW2011_GWA1_38_7]OHA87469.1 MAG: hypothetical protein A2644_02825 [Candidatus Zambryskibacteria bacterium RIFCSPHIGHO2_01_FULL_39_63]OHA94891.1 MAG: hypothetical protein A3B88_00735 [Candidatus Zambryskibacteria bacterium RIFCSPHIGHO2_02_FULL_39_19]OHA99071.1 MAG: hypothetical protein A3F20_02685 [Candidatus Zambryskibacteria bacterium RIFCSPHIGHO2_12_FULL_39_21]OHB01832.1 MAG: hypothetical protein A3A96_00115 [Candidatus Zambryskibac